MNSESSTCTLALFKFKLDADLLVPCEDADGEIWCSNGSDWCDADFEICCVSDGGNGVGVGGGNTELSLSQAVSMKGMEEPSPEAATKSLATGVQMPSLPEAETGEPAPAGGKE